VIVAYFLGHPVQPYSAAFGAENPAYADAKSEF